MEVTWAKHNESEPWGIRPYHRLDCAYANRLTVSKGTGSRIKSISPWRKSESPAQSAGGPLRVDKAVAADPEDHRAPAS